LLRWSQTLRRFSSGPTLRRNLPKGGGQLEFPFLELLGEARPSSVFLTLKAPWFVSISIIVNKPISACATQFTILGPLPTRLLDEGFDFGWPRIRNVH